MRRVERNNAFRPDVSWLREQPGDLYTIHAVAVGPDIAPCDLID